MQGLRVEKAVNGLPGSDDGGQRNHGDDEQASKALRASVIVGEATVGCPAAQNERNPQRHGSQGVREVVDRIREQSNRPADEDHQEVRDRGAQQEKRLLLRARTPLGAGLQRVID